MMKRLLLIGIGLGLVGCGSSAPPSGMDASADAVTTADAAASMDAGTDAEAGTGACNDLVAGTMVGAVHDPNPAPQAMGGSIAAGTYGMTDAIYHDGMTGPIGTSGAESLRFRSDGTADFSIQVNNGTTDRYRLVWTTAQSTLTFTQTCPPNGSPGDYGYTATPTSLVLLEMNPNFTLELRFTKQ